MRYFGMFVWECVFLLVLVFCVCFVYGEDVDFEFGLLLCMLMSRLWFQLRRRWLLG